MLRQLPYEITDLEPYISEKQLKSHFEDIYSPGISNLNALIRHTIFKNADETTLIKIAGGEFLKQAAQVWNHTFYFSSMRPRPDKLRAGSLRDAIIGCFGSEHFFRDSFINYALTLKGEGWIWLIISPEGSLEIIRDNNTGHPLKKNLIPLLNCDLWDHAYAHDYKNNRQKYLEAFFKLVDWSMIEKRYLQGLKIRMQKISLDYSHPFQSMSYH